MKPFHLNVKIVHSFVTVSFFQIFLLYYSADEVSGAAVGAAETLAFAHNSNSLVSMAIGNRNGPLFTYVMQVNLH